MELIKYRDAGLHTYTYFWIDEDQRVASPYFDIEEEAMQWLRENGVQRKNVSDLPKGS